MSLRILVDEDTQARRLIEMLRIDGHNVLTIKEAGISGASDTEVMQIARNQKRVLLTRNCDDFIKVYDGAYGSVREWSSQTEAELQQLGLVRKRK